MFTPKPDELLPALSSRAQVALLARALWREGYDDHLSGHITTRTPSGSLLCTPWDLHWNELTPDQIIEIDLNGERVAGDWPVPPGIPLHIAVHAHREIEVVVHGHSRWGTVWANMGRVPGLYDQSSMKAGDLIACVDEYDGPVSEPTTATGVVDAMGSADVALLRNHGVLVFGRTIASAYARAVALERRCRMAWFVESGGGGREVTPEARERYLRIKASRTDEQYYSYWSAAARAEIATAPDVFC